MEGVTGVLVAVKMGINTIVTYTWYTNTVRTLVTSSSSPCGASHFSYIRFRLLYLSQVIPYIEYKSVVVYNVLVYQIYR